MVGTPSTMILLSAYVHTYVRRGCECVTFHISHVRTVEEEP